MNSLFFIENNDDSSQPEARNPTLLKEFKLSIFLKYILENGTTEIHVYVTRDNLKNALEIFIQLKKHLQDLIIHVYTCDLLFESVANLLAAGHIDSICFGVQPSEFIKSEFPNLANFELQHVRCKDSEYSLSTLNTKSKTAPEVLLVLMPSWNNLFPPFGLAHIGGALKALNVSYDVADLNNLFFKKLDQSPKEQQRFRSVVLWQNHAIYLDETKSYIGFIFDELLSRVHPETKYIGFSLFGPNLLPSQDAMRMIREKRPDIKIFCGGPQALGETVEELIKENLIDVAVTGEGEQTVSELILRWQKGESIEGLPGSIQNVGGTAKIGPIRDLLNINDLPLPDFSKFPLYRYEQRSVLPVYCSRGCVAKCSFCAETIYWRKFRALSPEKIVDTMERHIQNFGINTFNFNDSLLNGSHKLLEEMCDLILARHLDVNFRGYSRFDSKMTPQLLTKLGKAGCRTLLFGFESGSQKIVDLMNKKVFVNNYREILAAAFAAGIKSHVCIIVGFPGETWKDYFTTLFKAIELHPYIESLNLAIMEISPNSLIEKDFEKYGIVNAQNRYWRTKYWTNFFLLRLVRFYIFRFAWILATRKTVSMNVWDRGYLLITKKLVALIKVKFSIFKN